MNYPYQVLISYVNSDGVIFRKILRDIHDYKEFGKLSSDLSAALNYCSGCRGYSFLTEFIYPKKPVYFLFEDSDFQIYD